MNKKNQKGREYFRAFYRGNRLLWATVMGLTVLVAMVNPAISWLLKETMDLIYALDGERLLDLMYVAIWLMVGFEAADLLCKWLLGKFLQRALGQYKAFAFEKLAKKSISTFSQEHTSRYLSVLTNDLQAIESQYLTYTFDIVQYALVAIASAVMIFWYGGKLAWVCIILSLVPVVVSIGMGPELEKRTRAVSDQNEHFVAQLKDLLSGFSVLKSFKAEPESAKLFDAANRTLETTKRRKQWWESILVTLQSTCSVLLQFGVVFAAGFLTIQGEMTPGVAVGMINLCGSLVGPIAALPQMVASRQAAKGLVVKLAELMEENIDQAGEPIPPVLGDAIRFQDVSFAYEPGKPVLRGIDLTLEAGKRYAIVGASGSGKSTLLNLLMGASGDYTGSITLDYRELRTVDPNSLYDLVSLIGQNVFLFDDTIRRNITMFREFPEEAVDSAVVRSGLVRVLEEKGEDYRCGENGQGLSGGERQRVSIARSLLRGTPVLMLDEATAALDSQTAWEVTDAILNLDGLTRIVVTHRLEESLLRRYDGILVLREGRIIEQGTFQELMAEPGYFYSMFHLAN